MKKIIIQSTALIFSSSALLNVEAKGLGQAVSQQADSKASSGIEEVRVIGRQQTGSLTSISVDQARLNLEQIPGGIGFVEIDDYADNFTQSLGDTLVFTPGVYADTSAQRENRISIRGSGLNATFERRGINVYRDGVPITRASGITEFQEVDPLSVQYIEVFKGANGVQYGGNALGGAINIVTPTGQNTEPGNTLRVEAGSFNSSRLNVTTSGKTNSVDYYFGATKLDSDGFRAHSEVDSVYGFGNIGIAFSESVETRFYLTSLDDQFELAGSTTLEAAMANPETAVGSAFVPDTLPFLGGPGLFNAIDDDWDRNLKVTRLANKTSFAFENWQLETGVWFAKRKLDHAITRFAGIIDQDEDEQGISFRASNQAYNPTGLIWSLGLNANQSDNDAKRWFNEFRQRGQQRSQDQQDADNVNLYAQLSVPLSEHLRFIIGGQHLEAARQNKHIPVNERDTEDDSGKLDFSEFSPQLGLLWDRETHQWYLNVSQAHEVPGIADLTSAGVLPFDPLDTQISTTLELGSRGQTSQWAWDISFYRSKVENEFIDFTNGFVTNTVNSVSDTVHQGLEAGVDWLPNISLLNNSGINLSWRHVLTVNDFTFDKHPIYNDNTLAGVPELNYLTELKLNHDTWHAGINVRYVANGPYADFANTVQTDGYTLIGFNAAWVVSPSIRLFVSAENLSDKAYISNVSTVGLANDRSQIFTPGQGRATFAGVRFNF